MIQITQEQFEKYQRLKKLDEMLKILIDFLKEALNNKDKFEVIEQGTPENILRATIKMLESLYE